VLEVVVDANVIAFPGLFKVDDVPNGVEILYGLTKNQI